MNYLAKLRTIKKEHLKDYLGKVEKQPWTDTRKWGSEISKKSPPPKPVASKDQSDGRIGLGLVAPSFLDEGVWWICVELEGTWRWISMRILQAKRYHEKHPETVEANAPKNTKK